MQKVNCEHSAPLDTTYRSGECKNKRVIEWISIIDKLPEKTGKYLCFVVSIDGAWHLQDYWFDDRFKTTEASCITHWADASRIMPDKD